MPATEEKRAPFVLNMEIGIPGSPQTSMGHGFPKPECVHDTRWNLFVDFRTSFTK
jgi:hypothetical protein